MGENETKLPVSQERIPEPASQVWQPFEGFRREIDRLFEDFGRSFWQPSRRSFFAAPPLWGREKTWSTAPAVDVVENGPALCSQQDGVVWYGIDPPTHNAA